MNTRLLSAALSFLVILIACVVGAGYWLYVHSPVVRETAAAEDVRACFEEAEKLTTAKEAFDLGQAYFGSEKYNLDCARISYDRAIAIAPREHPSAWHQLGRIDFLQGDFDNALFKFNKQKEFFEDSVPNVHYMQGLTYGYKARKTGDVRDWAHAEESFKRYIKLDPLSPWARTDLSWIYFAQGKYSEMKPALEEGLLANPEHPWLLNMYGLALLNTDDREGAQRYFRDALRFASELTPEEWGRAYPGNNPALWVTGLAEMRALIEENLALAERAQ